MLVPLEQRKIAPRVASVLPLSGATDRERSFNEGIAMFFVQEGFTYRNFLMDMIAIFAFVVWFWLLIVIYGDLFRRHDISGWGKGARAGSDLLPRHLCVPHYARAKHGRT